MRINEQRDGLFFSIRQVYDKENENATINKAQKYLGKYSHRYQFDEKGRRENCFFWEY